MNLHMLFAVASVALVPPSAIAEVARAQNTPDQIHATTYSWGQIISEWTVYVDGSGSFTTTHSGSDFNHRIASVKRWGPRPDRFEKLSMILKTAEPYAHKNLTCLSITSDGPYGEVLWRRGGNEFKLDVQYACRSKEANAIYDLIRTASKLAQQWSTELSAISEP